MPALVVAVLIAACGTGSAPSQMTKPSAPPTVPAATATATATVDPNPTPAASPDGVIVTFDVAGEQFRIELTDPEDVVIAGKLLDGKEAPGIPSGLIVRGETGVNAGYSWSIDPDSVEFADFTTEVCDGLPSQIEDGSFTYERFCPWSAKVIAIGIADGAE